MDIHSGTSHPLATQPCPANTSCATAPRRIYPDASIALAHDSITHPARPEPVLESRTQRLAGRALGRVVRAARLVVCCHACQRMRSRELGVGLGTKRV